MAPATKKACILVHGITTTAGEARRKIGLYGPHFEARGYRVELYAWGWGFFFLPWFRLDSRARQVIELADRLDEEGHEVVGLGHSFGCVILARATELGAPISTLGFLNAAAEQSVLVGKQVHTVINCYDPGDPILRIAGIVPHPKFGNLGRANWRTPRGVASTQKWSINLNTYGISGHGGALEKENVERFGPVIVTAMEIFRAFFAGEIASTDEAERLRKA